VLTGRGPEQQVKGVGNTLAFINVALALGKKGRPFTGYGCLTGQGNGQGGREHGQKADQLPGYRRIGDPAARRRLAQVWEVEEKEIPGPGRSAYELLSSLGEPDGVRALLVVGSNPVVSAPDAGRIEARLRSLDFLAVSDFFLSETAALAHVVLPSAQWAEEEGTMTNLEGRVVRRRRVLSLRASPRRAGARGFTPCGMALRRKSRTPITPSISPPAASSRTTNPARRRAAWRSFCACRLRRSRGSTRRRRACTASPTAVR